MRNREEVKKTIVGRLVEGLYAGKYFEESGWDERRTAAGLAGEAPHYPVVTRDFVVFSKLDFDGPLLGDEPPIVEIVWTPNNLLSRRGWLERPATDDEVEAFFGEARLPWEQAMEREEKGVWAYYGLEQPEGRSVAKWTLEEEGEVLWVFTRKGEGWQVVVVENPDWPGSLLQVVKGAKIALEAM